MLTETRIVGAIIQPKVPEQVQPKKMDEKMPISKKQAIVKQINSKSPQETIEMTISEVPRYSNFVQKCKFV